MIPVVKKWGALLLLGGILCLSLPLRGQTARVGTITGRVTNAHTGEPLPFANVFLTNTTLGTTTGADGRFTLRNLPLGTVEVGASFVGFTFMRRSVRLASPEPLVLDVALIPSAVALQGVEVKARGRKPGRYYEQFRREFLGTTPFARQCEIENPEVLAYEKRAGILKVSAREPLRVVNRALGYEVLFFLEAFRAQRDQVRFVGNPKFTELKPKDASQAAAWAKNRRSAYFASIRYLLRLLVEGRWEEEGYLMVAVNAFHADGTNLLYPYIGRNFSYLDPAKVVLPGKLPFERRLRIDKPVEVFNLKKYNFYSPYRDVRHDHARLVFKDVPLDVTTDGWAYNPTGVLVTGFLALDRVASMLPRDYEPEGMPAVTYAPLAARRLPLFDTLSNRLRKLPRQQLYLHHDKHYYWSGNTVWLSAYLTDAATGDLYPDDQLLHAELVSPAGKVLTAVKLKAEMGRAAGQFHLPDTAATGVYRLRAYTNWMQKVPGSYLYDQPLVVYNLRNPGMTARAGGPGKGPAPQAPNPPATVHFYPEGGRLLEGISGVAGIRATGPDGSGVALRGRLFDDLGQETAVFATDATGLGKVAFRPLPGRTYQAEALDGGNAAIHLPPVHREGFALRVDNGSPDQVRVRVDQAGAPPADSLLLVVQHRRTLVHTAQLVPAAGGVDLSIPKAKLPPGVNRLVLFDRKGRLHAQRLVYREPNPPPFRIRVDGPAGGPGPRQKVALELTISDSTGNPVAGSFSLSVTDARQQPADSLRRTLASNQWLMAELAGYVEAPHRYLSPGAAGATDLLMLVQSPGWSSWAGLLEQSPPVPVLDDYFMTVSGRVTDPKGRKLLPGHRVIMLSADTTYPNSHQAFTDSAGRFRFPRLDFSDTIRVSFLVYNPQGKTAPALVTLDPAASPGGPADPYPAYLLRRYWPGAEENRPREAARSGLALDKVQQLQEVVVKGRKKPKSAFADAPFTLTSLVADYVRNFGEDSYAYSSIYQMLARVPGVQVSMNGTSGIVRVRGIGSFGVRNAPSGGSGTGDGPSSYGQEGNNPLFLLDDVPLMGDVSMVLDGINPSEVSRIEVITGAGGAAFGARGGNGVISIYLKTFADYDKEAQSRQTKKYVLAGYLTPKPLPTPDYGGPEADRAAPDQRDVLYWNPLLRTDEAGNATVQFYNSDQADRLLVVLEGITATGQPVSFTTVISKQ